MLWHRYTVMASDNLNLMNYLYDLWMVVILVYD